MVLEWSLLLGMGLLAIGLAGILGPTGLTGPQSWLAWCDLFGAWAAYFIAADIRPTSSRAQRIGGPFALSFGLFVACFVTSKGDMVSWLIWPTFTFACAFLFLGIFRWIKREVVPKHRATKRKGYAKRRNSDA